MYIVEKIETKTKLIVHEGNVLTKIYKSKFSKIDVFKGALNHARIEAEGINIPKVISVRCVDGMWAIDFEYIEGESLDQLMLKYPNRMDEYIELFTNLQKQILGRSCIWLTFQREKMISRIKRCDLDAITRLHLIEELVDMPKCGHICHGEFLPENIVITKEGIPYVIDWAHVTQGNGAADIVRTYLLCKVKGQTEFAEKYINTMLESEYIKKEDFEKWCAILGASLSSFYESDKEKLLAISQEYCDKLGL